MNVPSAYWWMTLLRGLLWILLGIVFLARRPPLLLIASPLLGWAMLIDGLISLAQAFVGRNEHDHEWWLLLLAGLAGIVFGTLTFYKPTAIRLAVVSYMAIWSVATGVLQIVGAMRLHTQIQVAFWLGLAGLASVIFGVLLAARPAPGVSPVFWLIGVYATAFGVLLVLLAISVRGVAKRVPSISS